MTYSAKIVDKYGDELETIEIGFREAASLSKTIVLVEEDAEALVQVVCYTSKRDDYHFRSTAIIWKVNVVIGIGHRLFIMNLESEKTSFIDLKSYFSGFYSTQDLLLITSGEHLHAIDESGKIEWIARNLGIDGVIIDEVLDDKVYGQGELDPPNGWQPFVLDLCSGAPQ